MPRLELLFVLALVLYSLAIWSDRIKKELRAWMLAVFGTALIADILGTVLLCAVVSDAFRVNVHTVTGLASLAIMLVHYIWALQAFLAYDRRSETRFRRWSVWAWGLWLVSFLSGALFH